MLSDQVTLVEHLTLLSAVIRVEISVILSPPVIVEPLVNE